MNRRDFFKLGAGALLAARSPIREPGAGIPQGTMTLPENPGFATKHLVTIILGNGARTVDVVDNDEHAPFQSKMAREGTLFRRDFGETASLPGYMVNELLTGRSASTQRPRFPTWTEYLRKKTGGGALAYWMLQSVPYYGGWTWDVKHFSTHPDYGARYGATALTMHQIFHRGRTTSARELVRSNVEDALGHTPSERRALEAWLADAIATKKYELPSMRQPVIDDPVQIGDCQAIHLAGEILKSFEPRSIIVQVLGLGDAHGNSGLGRRDTGYRKYLDHVKTTDELIGSLWAAIQRDPYLRASTALVIRPDCGRNGEVDAFGQLGHSPGEDPAHHVWTLALGPDFRTGHVVHETVERRDLAPTLTYLMSGENAEHSEGHVRTQLFAAEHDMPAYVLPPTAGLR